jgi:hypothetical protein
MAPASQGVLRTARVSSRFFLLARFRRCRGRAVGVPSPFRPRAISRTLRLSICTNAPLVLLVPGSDDLLKPTSPRTCFCSSTGARCFRRVRGDENGRERRDRGGSRRSRQRRDPGQDQSRLTLEPLRMQIGSSCDLRRPGGLPLKDRPPALDEACRRLEGGRLIAYYTGHGRQAS